MVQVPSKIETFDTIYQTNPINSNWGSAGCYAGARGQNSSLIGGYSVVNWSGWKLDRAQSDMRDFEVVSSTNSSQQNLRFLVRYTDGNFTTPRQAFNWTGLRSTTVQSIQSCYENLQQVGTSVNIYDPYYRQTKNVNTNGVLNTPLNIAPLTELKINNLIWMPYFTIREVEFYSYNVELGCYTTRDSVENPQVVTWAQIKNQDKLPAGANYDDDLFTKGFKIITPRHEDGIRIQYVAGCILVPLYGECSCVYDQVNDAYVQSTNPVDHQVYDGRGILGSVVNDSGEFPQFNNQTNMDNCNLIVLSEFASSVTGGTVYATPPGICFANFAQDQAVLTGSSYCITPTWNFTTNFQIFNSASGWTTFWNANYDQPFFYEDQDPSATNQNSPSLFAPCTAQNIKGDFATKYASLPNAVRYFVDASNAAIYSVYKSNRVVSVNYLSYFSIQELWATIASLGCYVAADYPTAQSAPTGKYCGNNNRLYLGYMDRNGVTNGTMLQGIDIIDATQSEIDDIIQGTPYKPIVPGEGDKSDDPTNKPNDPGKGEGKITGDKPGLGEVSRWDGSIGANYFALTPGEANSLCTLLWQQPKNFYEALNIVSDTAADDIFKYLTCFRYLPINMSSFTGVVSSNDYPVYMGTGAIVKNSSGTSELFKKIDTSVVTAHFGQWNLGNSPFNWHDAEFLNYTPYTKLVAVLPYVGPVELDLNKVSAFENSIKNVIIDLYCFGDLKTGIFTYVLTASDQLIFMKDFNPCYEIQLSGNNSVQQSAAITSANFKLASSILSAVGDVAAGLQKQSKLENEKKTEGKGTLSKATIGFGIAEQLQNTISHGIDIAQASCAVSLASRQVPEVYGSTGGSIGAMCVQQKPYLIQYRIKTRNADNYGHTSGFCCESAKTLSDVSGFTQVVNPDLSSVSATAQEIGELSSILTTGFYV